MDNKLGYFGAVKFLSRYFAKYKSNFIMFYLGWVFDIVLAIATPILFGIMVDEIVYYQNTQTFLKLSLVFFCMIVFSCILLFFHIRSARLFDDGVRARNQGRHIQPLFKVRRRIFVWRVDG